MKFSRFTSIFKTNLIKLCSKELRKYYNFVFEMSLVCLSSLFPHILISIMTYFDMFEKAKNRTFNEIENEYIKSLFQVFYL